MYANKAHSPQHSFVPLFVSVCTDVFVLLSARFTYEILIVEKKFKPLSAKVQGASNITTGLVASTDGNQIKKLHLLLKKHHSVSPVSVFLNCCAFTYIKVLIIVNQ